MYLYYCYRDRMTIYIYNWISFNIFKTTYVGFTIIESSVHSLTSSLCSVSVSDRIIDGIDKIALAYGNTLLSIDT